MKIQKNILYMLGIFILIVGVGYFIFNNTLESDSNIVSNSNGGEVQKIVIGMKNLNYYPNTITVKVNQPVSISLDESVGGCFRSFTIREFGIAKYLATPKDTIEFTPTKKGTFRFACSMGMGTGTIIVE